MSAIGRTRLLAADPPGIAEAASLLRAGKLVAFPTETVYGLGADARSPKAVAEVYRAKGRPSANPLIVHVADLQAAAEIARFGPMAMRLAEAFWPGPLTLVLPLLRQDILAPAVTAGLPSVGVRVPAGDVAQALLREAGCPVAAPSANPSGRVSPTEAAHVMDEETGLAGRIAAVLDGGPTTVGLESTILAPGDPRQPEASLRLLRPGGVPVEDIASVAGCALTLEAGSGGPSLEAPGMMVSHYAPRARLRLDAVAPEPGEAWLGFGADPPEAWRASLRASLSEAGDLSEAARRLFATLRRLDEALGAGAIIAVARVPEAQLGLAIKDRLQRAAAPRE
ncbi:MAG: L-threonylcarbamoyladenylate synthase [Pseudomonadota bacterium]